VSLRRKDKIKECHKAIQSLERLLKIVGMGAIAIIGLFIFFKNQFSLIIAQSLVISTGLVILLILTMIYLRYGIIKEINLGGEHND